MKNYLWETGKNNKTNNKISWYHWYHNYCNLSNFFSLFTHLWITLLWKQPLKPKFIFIKYKRHLRITLADLFPWLFEFPSLWLQPFCSLHIFIFRTTTDFPSCLPGLSLWRLQINPSICCPVWIFTWWITVIKKKTSVSPQWIEKPKHSTCFPGSAQD